MSFSEIRATNFKSLKNINFRFNKLNILVGPNGSGKTNFTELFRLVTECLRPTAMPNYPLLPWWGYNNIVWKGNEELPISFGFDCIVGDNYHCSYDATISGSGGQFRFLEEKLKVDEMFECSREAGVLRLTHADNYFTEVLKHLGNLPPSPYGNQPSLEILKSQVITGIPSNRSILNLQGGYSSMYSQDHKYAVTTLSQLYSMDKPITIITPIVEDVYQAKMSGQLSIRPFVFFSGHDLFSPNDIMVIRQTDYKKIKQPSTLQPMSYVLEEDGNGLQNLLFQWKNAGGIPQRIEYALMELFPRWQLLFEITSDGRILMKVKDGDAYYNPPSLPDGFYRLLVILSAIELRPKILIIDEVESSLHLRFIEYLIDTFKTSESTILLTTHSPLVVDLAKPEDLVILERIDYETQMRRIDNSDEVRKKLTDLKVSLSESWLYGNL